MHRPRPRTAPSPLLGLLIATFAAHAAPPIPHDVHAPFRLPSEAANDVRDIAVAPGTQNPWVATRDGVFALDPTSGTWTPRGPAGPAFAVASAPDGSLWIGSWNGLYHATPDPAGAAPRAHPAIHGPVGAVGVGRDGSLLVAGPDGLFLVQGDRAESVGESITRQVHRIVQAADQRWHLATAMGLHRWSSEAGVERVVPDPDHISVTLRGLAFDATGRLWAGALGGLQIFNGTRLAATIPAAAALPSSEVQCVAVDPSGRVWAGTAAGLARQVPGGWTVRRGRRWLLHDDVRAIAFDHAGTAWVATAAGVSALRTESLSLDQKAARFHQVLEARHVRPPGIVEKCQFRVPGDLSTWAPTDDDNDGGYTAVALAMESYRYAVTRDPAARAAAERAFAACEFLQHVTGTPGFLARTVIPADWKEMHDPNETYSDEDWADRRVREPRAKRVPVRWRPSSDGKWLWKGDTSSDEVTAHLYGYFVYHELAADDAQRQRVRIQICRIVDHLIDHGFVLQDSDGKPTRWGVWAPERLNHDPDWAMDRGVNSVELLSYLKLAHHVSGEERFQRHYRELIENHRYDRNVLEAPNLNPAWRTYIDMELLAFAYPALLTLETDPRLRRVYHRSFERWRQAVKGDGNPFFDFLHASLARHRPPNRDLDAARAFLAETPLDLVRWDVDNATREDVALQRAPELEGWQTRRRLPPTELGYSRTDQNPWLARQGDGGRTESDGVFWLLPYWMGRHLGVVPAQIPSK